MAEQALFAHQPVTLIDPEIVRLARKQLGGIFDLVDIDFGLVDGSLRRIGFARESNRQQ